MAHGPDISPTGYISPRALVSATALVAPSARIYGPTIVGDYVFVDTGVILGYPAPLEQQDLKSRMALSADHPRSFDSFIDSCVEAPTLVGSYSIIRSGTIVYSGTKLEEGVDIAHNVHVRENCLVGGKTHIITGAQVMADVKIGRGCRIAGTLCNRCHVGDASSMLGHLMHKYRVAASGHIEDSPKIGDGVLIGRESAVVGAVAIGDFSIVAAGSVITQPVPAATVWGRNPAVQIGVRSAEEIKQLTNQVEAARAAVCGAR